jgi:hypothetical protein
MMSLIRGGGWSDLARGARLGRGGWAREIGMALFSVLLSGSLISLGLRCALTAG